MTAWGPAVLWAAVLFFLSARSDLPSTGSVPLGDKLVHVMLYLVLGACLSWGRGRSGGRPALGALVLVGWTYAASDEVHQAFVPGRDPSLGDWAADAVGVTLGVVLASRMLRTTSEPL